MAFQALKTKLYIKVKDILQQYPKTRENDTALMAKLWEEDITTGVVQPSSAKGFLQTLEANALTNWESATRVRRKIMEVHPELRGLSYVMRKSKAQTVKKQIKAWPNNIK